MADGQGEERVVFHGLLFRVKLPQLVQLLYVKMFPLIHQLPFFTGFY
jgi:hypothetical protein